MKFVISFCLFMLAFAAVKAQSKDTLPPYQQVPIIPPFKILLPDSSVYTKAQLPKHKTIIITYFNPNCDHCQKEAEQLSANMHLYKKAFFVMAGWGELDLIKEFAEKYGLSKFSNVIIGKEAQSFLPIFYKIELTPYTAVYSKKGKFIKDFRLGYMPNELLEFIK